MSLSPNFQATDNLVEDIQALIKEGYQALALSKQGSDWQSVYSPWDAFEFKFNQQSSVNSHLNSVMFSEEFNAEYEKTLPLISNFYADIASDKSFYQAYEQLQNQTLNPEQQHILKNTLDGFKLSGVTLEGEALARFKQIQEQLSVLSNAFSKNALQATNEWKKSVTQEDLSGYPASALAKVAVDDHYELNLQMPVYLDVMTYAENEALREEVYRAYISRASEVGITSKGYDNRTTMDEILTLRAEMAQLLGFEHYAQLSLESKMVDSTEMVLDFLWDLVDKAKVQALEELAELEAFAQKSLKPWDLMFYSEQLKEQKFGFSKSDLTPYFPESGVLKGLFSTIEKLYGIRLSRVNEVSYHPDVRILNVERESEVVGRIYLDLYARKDKRGGAWMADYQGLMDDEKPVAFVVCNLNSPSADKPALFEFDEIVTIFHEFGHALHHVLTTVKHPSVAGISGVPWDGVELPSQYMEFFCYEKDTVKLMSAHYQTGETLPDELYEKLIAAKNFQSAMGMLRQCEFSLWDLLTHMGNQDTYKVLSQVREKTALLPVIDENRFLNTFGHIFGGGYAAGYFSYKWAEVLAADAYDYVNSQGGAGSQASLSFLQNILEVGGSLDFMAQYVKFRGKKPQVQALLKANGIVNY